MRILKLDVKSDLCYYTVAGFEIKAYLGCCNYDIVNSADLEGYKNVCVSCYFFK